MPISVAENVSNNLPREAFQCLFSPLFLTWIDHEIENKISGVQSHLAPGQLEGAFFQSRQSASAIFREHSWAPVRVSELFQQSLFYLYTHGPFQNKQPAGMIQTSVQYTVKKAASFLDTNITPGSGPNAAKGSEN